MNRDKLIQQVKMEYAYLADMQGRDNHHDATLGPSADYYYEHLLQQVIKGIEQGKFDSFASGQQIVEAVANDKGRWGIRQ